MADGHPPPWTDPMTSPSRAATLAALMLVAATVQGQPPPPAEPAALRGESPQTRKRLAEAEQKLLGGKPAEAVDDLQRILDEAGDDLISVDGKRHRPARWVAHQILAKLPPDALKAYQDRVNEPARKLLEEGQRDRDPRPLWQLLDRYFVSRPARDGLLLLGDLLFERGEFRAAEQLWRRLLPETGPDVPYPTPPADPAAVRARIVLATIFQGELKRARSDLAAFKAQFPNASGPFAGKTGPYADALQALLDHPPRPPSDATAGNTWPTFGGGPGRTGRVAGAIPSHWRMMRPTWTAHIPVDVGARSGVASPAVRPPFGHPVIVNGRVYLSDGYRLMSFDLRTGKETAIFTLPNPTGLSANPDGCSSLSVAGGRLYARLDVPPPARARNTPKPEVKGGDETVIACYAPPKSPGRFAPPLRELWRVAPPAADGKGPVAWCGPPLVAGGRMWAALARLEGGRVVHAIACFDPADADKAPDRPAWVADVCDSPLPPGAGLRSQQELLTLAGRNVVLSSNNGAVVAVDAVTGRRAWGFQYPRAPRQTVAASRPPAPSPAVTFGGRVFVAPTDANRVYALDAETGDVLWESGQTEGAQILGIARNRVVVTTTGPLKGIRALSVLNGSYWEPDGWVQAPPAGLLGYGHGFATDDVVVWPSREGLYFLNADTGRPFDDPVRTMQLNMQDRLFGNVAYADGVLVVVTPTQVWGYLAEAPPAELPATPEPRQRFEAQIDRAEQDVAKGDLAAARDSLLGVVHGDLPRGWRAWAAARLLLLTPPVDPPRKLPPEVRDALLPELLDEILITPAGELVSLRTLVDRHTGREESPPGRLASSFTLPAERAPREPPSLPASARVARTVQLAAPAFPLLPVPGACSPPRRVYAVAAREVTAVVLETAEKSTFEAADAFTHAADFGDGFVAAGPFAVAVYRIGREPGWVFRTPETDPLPDSPGRWLVRTGQRPAAPRLSSFALAGSCLLARLGDCHMVAIDLKGRRVAWVLGTHGRHRYEPVLVSNSPRFEPHYFVNGRQVVVQLSDGRRWMVQARTGRVWNDDHSTFDGQVPDAYGDRTAQAPWAQPPVELDGNRVAFSDGPGLVRVENLAAGRERCWAYQATGEASLAGDPPQVRSWGETVVVAVRRNHGVELDRIEPAGGKSLWQSRPAFLDTARVDLRSADADPDRLYVPAAGKLLALSLADGRVAWEAELPDRKHAREWVVRAGRKVVIVYPVEAIPHEPVDEGWDRAVTSFLRGPLVWRLPWLGVSVYDSWTDRTVPVLLFDPESGELLKKVSVPASGPFVTACFEDDLAVLVTGNRVTWLR